MFNISIIIFSNHVKDYSTPKNHIISEKKKPTNSVIPIWI